MSRPLKILFLAANPQDTDRLRLDEEIRGIDQALRQAEFRDKFEIAQQWAVRVADLQAHLLRYKPDIVHFSGHGSRASEIILEDGDGNSQTVPARALSQLFAVLKDNVRCVVLNACYSEQQAQAIAEHVDFVIGMSKAIGDEAAISFAVAFYQALGYGKDVKTAFELGRVQIDLKNLNEQDTPKLLARSGDQKIFPDPSIFLPPPSPLSPPEAKDRANLLILLNKAKTFWIEGVLEKSVHNAVLLELGKETLPQAVEHPWEMVLELPDQTNQLLPSNTKITDVFEKMNRALLILGEPGSGKTITLLELARDLITRAEADPIQPIPVVFNLSSWTDKRQLLIDWLVFELSTKYQIPKKIGRAWLKDNRILPLLDGLDEAKPENRSACVEAINHFGETFGLPGCVVCSRVKEYIALSLRLKLNGAICLRSLTYAQVNSYLEVGGEKFTALRSILQKDEALQELAQSPLMLSIMSLAYQDLSVEDLTDTILATTDDRRKYLINIYIHRMFKRKGKPERLYSREQVIGWLSWLAQRMTDYSQTVFLIENMQSSWLQTSWHRQVYSLGLFVIYGLIIGLGSGLFWFISKEIFEIEKTLMEEYNYRMSTWLVASLLWAFSIGLIHEFKFKQWEAGAPIKKPQYLQIASQVIIYLVIWASIWFVIWLYMWGLNGSLRRLFYPFITGGFVVLSLGTWCRYRLSLVKDIQTAETLGWSWIEAKKGGIWGLIAGVCQWCIWLLWDASRWEGVHERNQLFAPERISRYSLLYLLMGTIVGILFFGLSSRILKTKALPNQGIKLSIKNAITAGLIFGIFTGMSIALIWVVFGESPNIGLGLGLVYLLTASLWYGGWDTLMHFILRLFLYFEGNTPRRFAHFLDYVTKLNFLQKVGGGYIFIHRLLLEHFAAMGDERKSA